jgi:integrase/recombinase XerD
MNNNQLVLKDNKREIKDLVISKNSRKFLEMFMENLEQNNRSIFTQKNYRADLEKYLIWYELIHEKSLEKSNAQTISSYKEFLINGGTVEAKTPKIWNFRRYFNFKKRSRIKVLKFHQNPLSISSQKRHLSTIKNFYEFLRQYFADNKKIFKINPVRSKLHAVKLKEIDVRGTLILKKDEWERIWETVTNPKDRLIVSLLYWGGLRLSELCQLKKVNFHHHDHAITFHRKGGYVHTLIPIRAKTLFKLYDDLQEVHKTESEYLFCGRYFGHISQRAMYNKIMKIFSRSGCRDGLGPHSFRKACATNLYIRTKDLLYVRDYLNHKDAKITQSYIDTAVLLKNRRIQ